MKSFCKARKENAGKRLDSVKKKLENRKDGRKETEHMKEIPIHQKAYLTLDEAAAFTGVGKNKLREISEATGTDMTLFVGSKRLLRREKLVAYLNAATRIR